MKARYRLIRRGSRGGAFYCVDTRTGKRTSLGTENEDSARQILQAKNQAERQPILNLQIARAHLAASDTGMTRRTWRDAVEALTAKKTSSTLARWKTAAKDKAFAVLLPQVLVETQAETLGQISEYQNNRICLVSG